MFPLCEDIEFCQAFQIYQAPIKVSAFMVCNRDCQVPLDGNRPRKYLGFYFRTSEATQVSYWTQLLRSGVVLSAKRNLT